jgi:hypothetical protein
MADHIEGRNAKCVLIEETTFGTEQPTPSGYALPFTSMDLSPGEGFVDFEEIDALTTPPKPMAARHAPSGRFTFPLHWDSIGWVLKYGIGNPATTGSDPYTHVFDLGSAEGEPAGFEIERQQSDFTSAADRGRKFWGGRCSMLSFAQDLEGAVDFDLEAAFLRYNAWAAVDVAAPTSYTSDAIDEMIGVIKVGGTQVGYVAAFNWSLDWQLNSDVYPVGNEGWRYGLARGRTRVNGTMDAFLNDDAMTALIDPAEAGTVVAFDVEYVETAATLELKMDIDNALLKITGEPVDTSAGLNVQFDWRAYGPSCLTLTLINSVASY